MLKDVLYRIRALLRRRHLEDELKEELQFHIDKGVEQQVQSGMDVQTARRETVLQFGGVEQIKEECRQSRGVSLIETTVQDVRQTFRSLGKNIGFSAGTIITLALGIATATVVFSIVDTAILAPVPFRTPQQLAWIFRWGPRGGGGPFQSLSMLKLWRDQHSLFEGVEAHWETSYSMSGSAGAELVSVSNVTTGLFPLLGVHAELGRNFDAGDANALVAIISHEFWKTHLGSDRQILGKSLQFDRRTLTIIGVMPSWFRFPPAQVAVWLPFDPSQTSRPGASMLVRLHDGVDLKTADAQVAALAPQLDPGARGGVTARLQPLDRYATNGLIGTSSYVQRRRLAVFLIFGAGIMVLFVACANAANLFLSRAVSRTREIAVRAALGGSRSRLVRHVLTEAFVVAAIAGVLGTMIAWTVIGALTAAIPPNLASDSLRPLQLNGRAVAVALMAAIIAALGAAAGPSFRLMRNGIHEYVKGNHTDGPGRANRLRGFLIAFESALALVLLTGAGLIGRTVWTLTHVDPGWTANGVLIVEPQFTPDRYPTILSMTTMMEQAATRAHSIPGVRGVALASAVPLLPGVTSWGTIESETARLPTDAIVSVRHVSEDYFSVMGIPILGGRTFDKKIDSAQHVVVITKEMANRLFFGRSAIGGRFRYNFGNGPSPEWMTVVGVVGDVQTEPFDDSTEPLEIYELLAPTVRARYLVIASERPSNTAQEIRSMARLLDADLPMNIKTMSQVYDATLAAPVFQGILFGCFAVLTLCLALAGVYAVVAYEVSQRKKEIAIRIALGAQRHEVMIYAMRNFVLLGAGGVLAGVLLSLWLTRFMATMLYGIHPHDAPTFIGASLVLVTAIVVGGLIPSIWASRPNTALTLRCD